MALFNFLLTVGAVFYRGFVFMLVWSWIVSEIFSVKTLSYTESVALVIVLMLIKPIPKFNKDEEVDPEKSFLSTLLVFVILTIILGLAFIASLFI